MRKDIQAINEAYESINKPFGDATVEGKRVKTLGKRPSNWYNDSVQGGESMEVEFEDGSQSVVDIEDLEMDASEDEEKNVKRHSLQRNTDAMRAQFTKDKSAANVRRPFTDHSIPGIKRDTLKTQGGI
jgi:hypothetical protein